jgi:nicotinamide riboside kinase
VEQWDNILPEFRQYLQKKVTLFGAESTGKTTLTEKLRGEFFGLSTKLFEWARPYLEMTDPVVTHEAMDRIWEGQRALQVSTYQNALKPLVIQDTDLWTTVGFWEDWDIDTVPAGIYLDAALLQSDLYIITRSNIPFEHDELRYGGDERQTNDQFWIDLCEKYGLPYVILDDADLTDRLYEASGHIYEKLFSVNPLEYTRIGSEYVQNN